MITNQKYQYDLTYEELQQQIEMLRRKMIRQTIQKGFADQETIKLSQELDQLIIKIQKECFEK